MKRILIALAVLLSVQVADAQVKTPEAAKKAVDAAQAASQNEKKAAKVGTWLKLAESYMAAYNAPAGAAWIGATKPELQLIMAGEQPVAVEAATLNGEPYTKEVYATKDYYFNQNGQLMMIYVTKPVFEDALGNALDAYKKAYEVDLKQSKVKDIKAGIAKVSENYLSDGMNCYMLGDYAQASALFGKAAEASATEPYAQVDTNALYNAGFTAWMAQDLEGAKDYFEKCIAVGYYYENGEVYAKLADIYAKLGDKEKSVATLEKGFAQFPQSQSILIGLINYYLENNENPSKLFELINLAKQNEPNNASLYYVEGNIYKQLSFAEKEDEAKAAEYLQNAVAAYDACEGINPAYEFGHIGKGVMYYELAVAISEKAQNEFDDKKYQALVDQFEAAMHDAIDPFEKAYAVSKDESLKGSIAEYLKNIYYRFISKGAQYEEGYNKYSAVVSGR